MSKQFDLEQQLMEVWQIIDDLKLFREVLDSEEFAGLSAEFTDKIDNFMLSLVTLYSYKFDKTYNTFKEHLEEFYSHKNASLPKNNS
jgi:negative regulator of replication initiation